MKFSAKQSTLIFIDLQGRLMPSIHEGDKVLQQCIRIAKIAKILAVPIIGTEQSPQSLGHNVSEIAQYCQSTISKEHFDGCQDGLADSISKNRAQIMIAGCETHVCVMQTALGLLHQNFQVSILVDAVGSRKSLDRDIALHRLGSSGATLVTVEMLAFEWLATARNSSFKEVLELIKRN